MPAREVLDAIDAVQDDRPVAHGRTDQLEPVARKLAEQPFETRAVEDTASATPTPTRSCRGACW